LDLKGRRTDHGENCITMSFMACSLHLILSRSLYQGGRGGQNMWHTWGRGGAFKGFWLGGKKGRHHCEDQGVDEGITLRWTLRTPGSMG